MGIVVLVYIYGQVDGGFFHPFFHPFFHSYFCSRVHCFFPTSSPLAIWAGTGLCMVLALCRSIACLSGGIAIITGMIVQETNFFSQCRFLHLSPFRVAFDEAVGVLRSDQL